jgi:hypothetical protein
MKVKKETIIVSFSGGRTSAYMSWWLKTYMSWLYDFKFVYANTGQEHPKTLEFVNNVDKYLELNLVWVEAVIHHEERKGTTHKVVNYETADRDGIVFEDMIKKYGLPNQNFIHCTRELKLRPIHHWMKVNGYKDCRQALGIRYDEYRRVKNDKAYIFPLATICRATKEDVLDFWSKQPFDLDLPEHLGNCTWCYKKSDKKLQMVRNSNPKFFDFPLAMEEKYSLVKCASKPDGIEPRKIFRHNRTAYDVLNDLNLPDNATLLDECAEECGSVII